LARHAGEPHTGEVAAATRRPARETRGALHGLATRAVVAGSPSATKARCGASLPAVKLRRRRALARPEPIERELAA
jgi:hypothetical protein